MQGNGNTSAYYDSLIAFLDLSRYGCKVSINADTRRPMRFSIVVVLNMDIQSDVITILQSSLGVPEGAIASHPDTRILGAIPEMDSMSVVGILASLEEQYGITVDDDEIDADVFATVGSLTAFVESKLG